MTVVQKQCFGVVMNFLFMSVVVHETLPVDFVPGRDGHLAVPDAGHVLQRVADVQFPTNCEGLDMWTGVIVRA